MSMLGPIKKSGFNQGIYQVSSARKETLGTMRIMSDGRIFRYAKAGASALAAGKMGIANSLHAAHINKSAVPPGGYAIGTKVLTLTITAGMAIVADELKGGYLDINNATGKGYSYPIESNSAISASETSIVLTLEEGLKVALEQTTTQITLRKSRWFGVTETAIAAVANSRTPAGIPLVAVTAGYYYWCQTAGDAIALIVGSPADGRRLVLGATAGALKARPFASANLVSPADMSMTVGVTAEYKPVVLHID